MADAHELLRALALSFDGVDESVACRGTALEQSSFKVAGKAFLFAQRKAGLLVVRLKPESALAADAVQGEGVAVGKNGWVTVQAPLERALSATLKRWTKDSYQTFAKAAAGTRREAPQAKRRR